MLAYYQYADGRYAEAGGPDDCQVIWAVGPSPEEINQIQQLTQAPVDFISAAVDRDERPRMEMEDECRLLVIRVACHDPHNHELPYSTMAFALVFAPHHIVTVCSQDCTPWTDVLSGRVRAPAPNDRLLLTCSLLMRFARQFLAHLSAIRREADAVEKDLELSLKNETLIRMLNLEKCLVYFTTSLRSNELIWNRLPRGWGRQLTEDEEEAIEDVSIEFRQAKDLADLHSSILSGMMDAFASVISNNLNVVIKVLTSVTIILMLPTLVASVYGMNVALPFEHSPHAFLITVVISVIFAAFGLLVFWKLKWF
jgi:magnesium transporter